MFRLLGFFSGVLLAGSAMLLLLGPDTAQQLEHEISTLLTHSGVSAKQQTPVEQQHLPAATATAQEPPGPSQPLRHDPDPAANQPVSAIAKPGTVIDFPESDGARGLNSQRSLFWQPFRSQYAARGFAARLQQATGVDVEVVQLAPGNVRVALRHRDAEQRQVLVARIESITGLNISTSMQ